MLALDRLEGWEQVSLDSLDDYLAPKVAHKGPLWECLPRSLADAEIHQRLRNPVARGGAQALARVGKKPKGAKRAESGAPTQSRAGCENFGKGSLASGASAFLSARRELQGGLTLRAPRGPRGLGLN